MILRSGLNASLVTVLRTYLQTLDRTYGSGKSVDLPITPSETAAIVGREKRPCQGSRLVRMDEVRLWLEI
jgi:hypothetical protein